MRHLGRTLVRIFNGVVRALTILIAVVVGMYMFILPYVFHLQPYVVLSGSMEPMIHTGAVALIDISDTDAEVGDVVTYKMDDGGLVQTGGNNVINATSGVLVTHRIIEERDGFFVTKGDNNEVNDEKPVYPYQIVGTFKTSIPALGFLLVKLTVKRTKYFAIGIIVMLNLAALMFSISADADEEDEGKEGENPEGSENKESAEEKEGEEKSAESSEESAKENSAEGEGAKEQTEASMPDEAAQEEPKDSN